MIHGSGGAGGMMGGYGGYGYGAVEAVLWVAIIAVIAWLAYYFLKGIPKESRAHDILNQRYAKGEITREEYLRMKEELK